MEPNQEGKLLHAETCPTANRARRRSPSISSAEHHREPLPEDWRGWPITCMVDCVDGKPPKLELIKGGVLYPGQGLYAAAQRHRLECPYSKEGKFMASLPNETTKAKYKQQELAKIEEFEKTEEADLTAFRNKQDADKKGRRGRQRQLQ